MVNTGDYSNSKQKAINNLVMWKSVLAALVIIGTIFFIGQLPASPGRLISPLGKEEEQSFLQKLVDNKVFEENKEKVRAPVVDWARGEGKPDPLVTAPAYIVVNKDGDVVYSMNADTKRPPASLTKLMTAMVVLDFIGDLGEKFEVQKQSVNLEPTILMVDAGEKLPVRQLLEAALITSANDGADVLARGLAKKLGGSREVFVKLMNQKAQNMNLTNTRFKNPTGYDDEAQFSTARDLAKMTYYALHNYPEIKRIAALRSSSIPKTEEHKPYELPNWNALLGVYPGVDGVKIGNTQKAKHVTIVTSARGDERFWVVLLGAPDRRARDLWTAQLLNTAFSDFGIKPFRVTQEMLRARSREWGDQLRKAQEE